MMRIKNDPHLLIFMYSVERRIKELDRNKIEYEYHLLNEFMISVGVFHNDRLALKVRDLLNGDVE